MTEGPKKVDTIRQGSTVDEAVSNLKEATTLYLEEFPQAKKKGGISQPLSGHRLQQQKPNHHCRKNSTGNNPGEWDGNKKYFCHH